MPDLDEELIARAIRWCADAGRQASPAQVRAALAPLSWDQLLSVRATLADPPPARPLGPWALADMGRGAAPAIAAERERSGQYRTHDDDGRSSHPAAPPEPVVGGPPAAARTRRTRLPMAPVIRRARDRAIVADETVPSDRRLPLDTLLESEGRVVLERLIRKHGARRVPIVRALAEGWRRGDGADPVGVDLDRILHAHGMARAFERRERDELLHAVRATGGVLSSASGRIGVSAEELMASLERLHAKEEAEAIREVHRGDVRRRATLSERVRLLLTDTDRLRDLELLGEVEDDLRARIPEHVRALRASGAHPLATALVQTLAMGPRELPVLLERLHLTLDLAAPRPSGPRPSGESRWPSTPAKAQRESRPASAGGRPRASSPRDARPRSDRAPGAGRTRPAESRRGVPAGPRRPKSPRRPSSPAGRRPRSK